MKVIETTSWPIPLSRDLLGIRDSIINLQTRSVIFITQSNTVYRLNVAPLDLSEYKRLIRLPRHASSLAYVNEKLFFFGNKFLQTMDLNDPASLRYYSPPIKILAGTNAIIGDLIYVLASLNEIDDSNNLALLSFDTKSLIWKESYRLSFQYEYVQLCSCYDKLVITNSNESMIVDPINHTSLIIPSPKILNMVKFGPELFASIDGESVLYHLVENEWIISEITLPFTPTYPIPASYDRKTHELFICYDKQWWCMLIL